MKISDFRDITLDGTIVLTKWDEETEREVYLWVGVFIPSEYDDMEVKFIYPTSFDGQNAICIEVE